MTYHSVKKQPRSKVFSFGLSIIGLFLFVVFWPTFRSLLLPVFEPVASKIGVSDTVIGKFFSSFDAAFTSKSKLEKENRALSLTIEHLENDLALREASLRQLGGVSLSGVPASTAVLVLHPLMRDVSTIYSTLLLSKGFKEGVQQGSLVYIRSRQAVCKITAVYTSTSLCTLFTSRDEITEGVVGSSTVFLSGAGGSSFTASIARGDGIKEGDVVYLKEDQSYTLGSVVKVDRDMQSAFWKVYVRGGYSPTSAHVFYSNQ